MFTAHQLTNYCGPITKLKFLLDHCEAGRRTSIGIGGCLAS